MRAVRAITLHETHIYVNGESRGNQHWRSLLLMANFLLAYKFRFSYKYEITISALWWWLIQNKEINQIISREWQRQPDWTSGGTDWRDDDKRWNDTITIFAQDEEALAHGVEIDRNVWSILDFLQFRFSSSSLIFFRSDLMYGPIVNKYLTNYRPATLFNMMATATSTQTPHITRDPIIIIKLFHHKLR